MDHKVEVLTTSLISFFFVVVGMQVDLGSFGNTGVIVMTVVVVLLALVSKYIGCFLGAKLGEHMDNRSCSVIGVGMIPRGEVGIIIAAIGLNIIVEGQPALSMELYSVIVMMAVVTTIVAPPILSKLFRSKYPEEFTITADDKI